MSTSRMNTNGASLEDCQTNIFALTELNGLKWKCVTTPQSHRWISIDQDLVLSAYAKCLRAGILCAWRRQPTHSSNAVAQLPLPDYRIDVVKELWVFWYSQDEPELLAEYTSELTCGENGHGNWANPGIQYEIRTLYFKALHNLIESYILGISFHFFVHGENIVCTYVNVQKQPAVFRLSPGHLDLRKKQAVILGPWSLRAHLIVDQSQPASADLVERNLPTGGEGGFPTATNVPSSSMDGFGEMSFDNQHSGTPTPFSTSATTSFSINKFDSSFESHNSVSVSHVEKLWSEWEQFFGLVHEEKPAETAMQRSRLSGGLEETAASSKCLPKMVLVDVDGVRMWFPSSLIVVQASEDLLMKCAESDSSDDELGKENVKTDDIAGDGMELEGRRAKVEKASSLLHATHIFPFSLRKKHRKRREHEFYGPRDERRNVMYNSMVNGSRAAQRYFEEACVLPSSERRRESVDSLSSSSGNKADDDSRWNMVDGFRGNVCDNEQCICRQCHLENQSRTPIPSTSGITHYGASSSRGSPSGRFFSSGGDDTRPGTPKEFCVPFHRRSPSCVRSPSPPRSPTWERRLSRVTAGESSDVDRGSPDWIHDNSGRMSSMSSIKGRSDSFDDMRHSPESSLSCGPDSPVYRRVCVGSGETSKRSGHHSPAESVRPKKSPSRYSYSDDFPNPSGFLRTDLPSSSLSQQVNSSDRRMNESLECSVGLSDEEIRCLDRKRRAKGGRLRPKREIEAERLVGSFDILHLATGKREERRLIEWVENKTSPADVLVYQINDASESELERVLLDDSKNFGSFFSKETGVDSINATKGFGSGVYDVDSEIHSSYLDNCSPSTVAMMETESPAEPVTDSVHLSPPASNERVEPLSISSTLSGTVANNLLARVGGPPSVGDYMIYPTPPSVDVIQSQQFSPQNVMVQSNGTSGFYPSTTQYLGINQPFPNATSVCNSLHTQTSHCALVNSEPCQENVIIIRKDSKLEPYNGVQGKFTKPLRGKLPLFGKVIVLEVRLSGKYGSDALKDDNIFCNRVYSDQRKHTAPSILVRAKRKHLTGTPFYRPNRDQKAATHKSLLSNRFRCNQLPNSLSSGLPASSSIGSMSSQQYMSPANLGYQCTTSSGLGQPSSHGAIGLGVNSGTAAPAGPMHGTVNSPSVNVNSSMAMTQLRPPPPQRPQSLAYAASPSGVSQHNAGFLSPPAYGGTPNMMGSMHGSPMAVTPQGMGLISNQSPSIMPGAPGHGVNMMHPNMSNQQPQQPFQQLSQFVNNTNFANQPATPFNQQQFYQHQMMSRGGLQGNMTPQHAIQSPGSFSMDSQASTPIEPPPSFSQAMNSQYTGTSCVNSVAPSMYAHSPQMLRTGSFIGSASSPLMPTGPRPMQNPMMMQQQPATSSALSNAMYNPRLLTASQNVDMSRLQTTKRYPEGKSLALAILLQDTVLDLHYDSAFDACPLCSCNGNIRTKELGLYITPPEVLRQPSAQQQLIVNKPTSGFYNSTTNTCTCGFSAIRHRYLSMKAGLFPEDAKEATDITDNQTQPVIPHAIWFDPISGKDIDFIALLREHTLVRDLGGFVDQVSLFSAQCERAVQFERIGSDSSKKTEYIISDVDQRELPLVFQAACEVACMEMSCRRPPHDLQSILWHEWGVQVANEMYVPREGECLAVLQEVGPVLEETLRKARSANMGGSSNIVEGPLTWRQFDRKSLKTGNNVEDDSLPEPVPSLLMASEKDAISASPQAIRMWEKMLLGPFDQPKDVLYIAVVPDNVLCVEKSKKYFDDLSRMYEQCRFGRHVPFTKDPLKDGILRVPTRLPPTHTNDFLKQVERHIGSNKSLLTKLSAYMQHVENELSAAIKNNSYVFSREAYRALLIENQVQATSAVSTSTAGGSASGNNDQMTQSNASGSVGSSHADGSVQGMNAGNGPSPVGALTGCAVEPLTPTNTDNETPNQGSSAVGPPHIPEHLAEGFAQDDPGTLPHVIVLYFVNPFLMGADESPLAARVVTVALMRAFTALLDHLHTSLRPQLQLEIISLQAILDYTGVTTDTLKDDRGQLNAFDQGRMEKSMNERMTSMDSIKTVAFSVYSQSRVLLPEVVRGILPKSMTRFGPASAMCDLLNGIRDNGKAEIFYKVPSKPFVLAPPPSVVQRPNNDLMQISTDETVLFVSYCLIGNDFLAATVTDHQGHLLDNCLINLRLKSDHKRVNMRYKQSTQIRDSLYRLWSYILGTLATGTKNWRLVIGKVGRIGHGEFKFWTQLLNKSYLKQVGSRMKHACRTCHQMPGTAETPGVLSACLVSLEPEAHLRIFPSSVQHDERFGKNARYRTLHTPDDCSCTHILVFPTSPELNLEHQGGSGGQDIDVDDFSTLLDSGGFNDEEFTDILSGEALDLNNAGPPPPSAGLRMGGNTGIPNEYAEVQLENQPLAAGYYVSTAPASELPDWFWSSCPSAKRRNPVHLKSSLHLNTNNVQQGDEISFGTKGSEACHHQLDSQATVDVLRYVLETYNALSWLNVDFVTGERRSCLPVHIQALMRLCNTIDRLIN